MTNWGCLTVCAIGCGIGCIFFDTPISPALDIAIGFGGGASADIMLGF